jgi:hypothetical protein
MLAAGGTLNATIVELSTHLDIVFVSYLSLFALKLLIDDAMHFHNNSNENILANGFVISLILWGLLCFSISLATLDFKVANYLVLLVFIIATFWLALNHIGDKEDNKDKTFRRKAWTFINLIHIATIVSFITFVPKSEYALYSWVYYFLGSLVIIDALFLGTFKRLVGKDI